MRWIEKLCKAKDAVMDALAKPLVIKNAFDMIDKKKAKLSGDKTKFELEILTRRSEFANSGQESVLDRIVELRIEMKLVDERIDALKDERDFYESTAPKDDEDKKEGGK